MFHATACRMKTALPPGQVLLLQIGYLRIARAVPERVARRQQCTRVVAGSDAEPGSRLRGAVACKKPWAAAIVRDGERDADCQTGRAVARCL
jgi:hypothetical protein